MNFHWNIETFLLTGGIFFSILGSIFILRFNWKKYGLVYFISVLIGEALCYFFVKAGLYSFPYILFPRISSMPFVFVLTFFPFMVIVGIRYSPTRWSYKIPFYWVLIHLGMLSEVLANNFTRLIRYEKYWDTWDSYTWWWIFFLMLEWVGGLIVAPEYRKPIDENILKYGKIGWFITHFILIGTIFLAGFYMGIKIVE